jgi:23S rRNA pseudouridine1911/1915/1917 synthase
VEPEAPLAWALVHRDGALLGVVKPAGLPTLPGGGFLERSLLALVRRRFPEAVPVHRLDRGASGVVLFARTPLARVRLSEAFRSGGIDKEYRALVVGGPESDVLEIGQPIGRVPHPVHGLLSASVPAGDPGARPARSVVRVLERRPGCALLAVRPLTGRPHQIRIHLAAAGHPLVGEPLYAPGGGLQPGGARPGDSGYLLHAERLRFRHPETGEIVAIESPPPLLLRHESSSTEHPT